MEHDYWIKIENFSKHDQEILNSIEENIDTLGFEVSYLTPYTIELQGICWENVDDDMKKISLLYPSAIISVKVEDLANDEFWKKYFLNGKMQHEEGEIIYGDFKKDQMV